MGPRLAGLWSIVRPTLGANVKLVLGVVDQSYSKPGGGDETTGDVAQILEDKYHVMETFFNLKQDKIAEMLADSMGEQIGMLMSGMGGRGGIGGNSMVEATENIQQAFRQFLDDGEMQSVVNSLSASESAYYMGSTGGLSGAGSRGINHRKKNPYAKGNAARPAFIDTGLYQTSFRAWLEE